MQSPRFFNCAWIIASIACLPAGCEPPNSHDPAAAKMHLEAGAKLRPPFAYPSSKEIGSYVVGKTFKPSVSRVLLNETFETDYGWSGTFYGIDISNKIGRWQVQDRGLNRAICITFVDQKKSWCRVVNAIAGQRMSVSDEQFPDYWYDVIADETNTVR